MQENWEEDSAKNVKGKVKLDVLLDILRNCNLGNTIKGTFILNSSSCQPEVNEGSNISKSLIVIHDFMTVYLSQNLIFFHTT